MNQQSLLKIVFCTFFLFPVAAFGEGPPGGQPLDTNAATICPDGQVLTGDGTCVVAPVVDTCPPGQFSTGFDAEGNILCSPSSPAPQIGEDCTQTPNIVPGADLRNCDLSGADLRNAILTVANLSGANLAGADLSGANLTGAIVTNANLTNADLTNTVFLGADLSDAIFTNATLNGTHIHKAIMRNVDLSGRDLTVMNREISFTDLSNANLSGANLDSVNLGNAILRFANLAGANLNSVVLSSTDLRSANLIGADLTNVFFGIPGDAQFADLRGAILLVNLLMETNNTTCPDGSNSSTNGRGGCP